MLPCSGSTTPGGIRALIVSYPRSTEPCPLLSSRPSPKGLKPTAPKATPSQRTGLRAHSRGQPPNLGVALCSQPGCRESSEVEQGGFGFGACVTRADMALVPRPSPCKRLQSGKQKALNVRHETSFSPRDHPGHALYSHRLGGFEVLESLPWLETRVSAAWERQQSRQAKHTSQMPAAIARTFFRAPATCEANLALLVVLAFFEWLTMSVIESLFLHVP